MVLRKYINDLNFCQKVNRSEIGKKFENSDLARSVEIFYAVGRDIRALGGIYEIIGIFPNLLSPFFFGTYVVAKNEKRENSESYQKFSTNPDLVFNR